MEKVANALRALYGPRPFKFTYFIRRLMNINVYIDTHKMFFASTIFQASKIKTYLQRSIYISCLDFGFFSIFSFVCVASILQRETLFFK